MEIGFLTAPFGKENLEQVLYFAADNGFSKIEILSVPGGIHIQPDEVLSDHGKKLKQLLNQQV